MLDPALALLNRTLSEEGRTLTPPIFIYKMEITNANFVFVSRVFI